MAGDITQILKSWNDDKNLAIEHLTPLVYGELHRIASAYMRGARPDHTLQATALIHEAYLRMVKQDEVAFPDRSHFFALAARIMRGILADFATFSGALRDYKGRSVITPPLVIVTVLGLQAGAVWLSMQPAFSRSRMWPPLRRAMRGVL